MYSPAEYGAKPTLSRSTSLLEVLIIRGCLQAKAQRAPDADILDQHAGEIARHNHQAEKYCIGSIDDLRTSRTSGTEGVHRSPQAWSGEGAQAEDAGIVPGGAVPLY